MTPEAFRLRIRTFAFRCVAVSEALPAGRKVALVLEHQPVRSAVSGSSNYRSATRAQSKAQFLAKLNVALEAVDESVGWREDRRNLHLIREAQPGALVPEGMALAKLFAASKRTLQERLGKRSPRTTRPQIENHKSEIA